MRYNETEDKLDYLFDVDKVTGDLRDSGRATQCKIHYSFAPSPTTGLLYAATHLSGPPKDERFYCPWTSWHDKKRAFRGAMLIAYDTKTDEVAWSALMIPGEGCRCLALDEERGWLYAISYPRDHFVVYDLKRRQLHDIGRIGSVNSQCIFLDRRQRAYTSDDRGRLLRFDPDRMELETLPHVMPHDPRLGSWHGVIYDAVADDSGEAIYMTPWRVDPRLIRFRPEDGPTGRLEDLGPVTQERDMGIPISMSLQHVGGLVFGIDGWLYYVRAAWPRFSERDIRSWTHPGAHGEVVRMHPGTLEHEPVCELRLDDQLSHYISRGARDHAGNLYFGHVGPPSPVGLFRLAVPGASPGRDAHKPPRMWG